MLGKNWNRLEWICAAAALIVFSVGILVFGSPIPGAILIVGAAALLFLGTKPKRLVYALIAYSMVVKFLAGDLGFPTVANYLCDGLLLLTVLLAFRRPREGYVPSSRLRVVAIILLLFWLVATVSAMLNAINPVLYIWACRNTFRLFGTLYCCVRLLEREDVIRLIKCFAVFFWINLAVCAIQYWVLGTGQDSTNGLFGTGSGGNAMMVIMMYSVAAFGLFGYVSHKLKLSNLVLILAACSILAAMAELKVFYALLIMLIGFLIIMKRPSFRGMAVVATCIIVLIAGVSLLKAYNPEFSNYFSLKNILESSSKGGYSSEYDLNRLTAVIDLDSLFMNSEAKKAIGLGFGAGQYTQYFESPLYSMWGELLHWTWFTDAIIFLETGYLGLAIYSLTFLVIALQTLKMKAEVSADGWIVTACVSIAVLCLFLIVYNCSLTTDPSCYFIGTLLAFPYILRMEVSR